ACANRSCCRKSFTAFAVAASVSARLLSSTARFRSLVAACSAFKARSLSLVARRSAPVARSRSRTASRSARPARTACHVLAKSPAHRAQWRGFLVPYDPRRLEYPARYLVGQPPGQQLIEQHTQRVYVAARIQVYPIARHLLGTHVGQSPHRLPQIGLARRRRV